MNQRPNSVTASEKAQDNNSGFARFGARITAAVLLSGLVGLSTYAWQASLPVQYEASAKILLLSPQDQYLPSNALPAFTANTTDAGTVDYAKSTLVQPALVNHIVRKYELSNDKDFIRGPKWQVLADLFSFDPTELAASNVRRWILIQKDNARNVLTIGFRGPNPDKATQIANDLAQGYLTLREDKRRQALASALGRLEQEIDSVEGKIFNAKKARTPLLPPEKLSSVQLKSWQSVEGERIAKLDASIAAQSNMLEHLLSRLEEANTRRDLDLLPPETRLLSQATKPTKPIEKKMLLISLLAAGAVFGVSLLVIGSLLLRRSKNDIAIEPMPALPEFAPLEHPVHAADIAINDNPQDLDDEEPASEVLLSRGEYSDLVREVVHDIADAPHRRIVLMSDDAQWGGHASDLAKCLSSAGRSVVFVSLETNDLYSDLSMELLQAGLGDFIDGEASSADILGIDDESGLHQIGIGQRELTSEDFFSHDFHTLLLALESTYDHLIIDIGVHFEDEIALQSLGFAGNAQACILTSETEPALVAEVYDVMQHFGYTDSLIYQSELSHTGDEDPHFHVSIAAE